MWTVKQMMVGVIVFSLFVWGFAYILWLTSPDHESPFIYACQHHTMDENICDGIHNNELYINK